MRLKLLFIALILLGISAVPALAQVGHKCVFNCGNNQPPPQPNPPQGLDCKSGTHEECGVCVSDSHPLPANYDPANCNNNQLGPLHDAPNSPKKSSFIPVDQGWWNRALARGKPGGAFTNDIFDPTWWIAVPTTFVSDVFNPEWQTRVVSNFTNDLFNRGWWWLHYQKPTFNYPAPTPIPTPAAHTKKK